MGLLHALRLQEKGNFKWLRFEGDFKNIINYLKKMVKVLWTIDIIIIESKTIVNNLYLVGISQMYREASDVADILTNVAIIYFETIIWDDNIKDMKI